MRILFLLLITVSCCKESNPEVKYGTVFKSYEDDSVTCYEKKGFSSSGLRCIRK